MLSKKEVDPYEMLQVKLRNLSFTGLNPMNRSLIERVRSGILIGILSFTLIGTGIYCCTMNFDILGDIIINLVVFGAIWQMILKTSFVFFKSENLSLLIKKMYADFWKPDSLNARQLNNIQLIYKLTALVDSGLTAGVTLCIVGHCITAILQGNHNMPVNVWLPKPIRFLIDTSPYYRFTQLFQFVYMVSATLSCVLQTDCLLAILIAMILAQFKMLKYKLVVVGNLETKEERRLSLSEIIQHHSLLLEMLKEIEDLFSPLVLQLLGTNIFLIVISFLTVIFIDEWDKKFLFAFVGSTGFGQFTMYSFLGQVVQDETLSFAEVAYDSKWENVYDTDMRKSILIVIQRSQKQVNITMGKFMYLNLENLTRVSRAMFSFFTFIINMKSE